MKFFVYREGHARSLPLLSPNSTHINSSQKTTTTPTTPSKVSLNHEPLGLTSTPSYSLASIYCSVLSKCFRGLSRPLTFSVVLRLLWISSIRPLMYFVVTASFSWSK